MNLSRETLVERSAYWQNTAAQGNQVSQNQTTVEQQGIREVALADHVKWDPELGRQLECSNLIAGIHDEMDPCIIHLFFKAQTPAVRCLNVLADTAVAEIILDVLGERYAANSFKVEYYGQYQKLFHIDLLDLKGKVSENCMCVVLKENPFSATATFRDETVRKIDEALADLPD